MGTQRIANQFNWREWSGGAGDLGTLLPLGFALIVSNGFPAERIFLLWGLVYVITGWYYRVPVSVQPLKAMAVLAIASGFTVTQLATASFLYGILFMVLALSGLIDRLQRLFSQALIRGVQVGIGLILAGKVFDLVREQGLVLGYPESSLELNTLLLIILGILLILLQFRKRKPVVLLLLVAGAAVMWVLGIRPDAAVVHGTAWQWTWPDVSFMLSAVTLLIVPQLPLTLGNAVYAAHDACHAFWGARAERVTPRRLAFSIGLSNTLIGLLGGFPICHGAGGIGAHKQFGARTGGATMLMGAMLVLVALIPGLSTYAFFIPVPLLGAMLLFDSFRMISFLHQMTYRREQIIALLVGVVSFLTRNLMLALLLGVVVERIWHWLQVRKEVTAAP